VADLLRPDDSSVRRIQRIEVTFERAEIDPPIRHRGRKFDHVRRVDPPDLPKRRPVRERRGVRPLLIAPVRRPRLLTADSVSASQLRGELDRARAAHVARTCLVPGPGAEPRAARQCRKREDEEQRAETRPTATKQRPDKERCAQQEQEDGCALDGVLEGQVASVATLVATFGLGRRAKR